MRTERSRAVNLAVLLVVLAALASLLEGPAVWLGALIVGGRAPLAPFPLPPRGRPAGRADRVAGDARRGGHGARRDGPSGRRRPGPGAHRSGRGRAAGGGAAPARA